MLSDGFTNSPSNPTDSAQTAGSKTGDTMGQNTITVTDADFATAIASDTPTLVDFWAEWCGPCKMMDGPLDELAGENAGKLTVAKLNVDENPSTMSSYSVMSIPTLIMFQDGEEKRRLVGARSKGQLTAELSDFLN
jgi:thioredoxin 1